MQKRAIIVVVAAGASLALACKPAPEELLAAVERHDGPAVVRLLDKGADANAAGGDRGRPALAIAADNGDVDIVKALLAHHADPGRVGARLLGMPGRTALQDAAYSGKTDVVLALLAGGAPIDDTPDSAETPLALAVDSEKLDTMDALIRGGAKVDGTAAEGFGYPPLVVAAGKGCVDCVRRLLAAHAQVDRRDGLGMTALCAATANEHLDVVRMLVAAGASPMAANRAGWTPAFTAQYHDRQDIVGIFRDAGITDFRLQPPPPLPPSGMGTVVVPAVTVNGR
jgi:ankyrin repeat protein